MVHGVVQDGQGSYQAGDKKYAQAKEDSALEPGFIGINISHYGLLNANVSIIL
jgi:hypothetical protein